MSYTPAFMLSGGDAPNSSVPLLCPFCGPDGVIAPPLRLSPKESVVLCRACGIYQSHPFPDNTAALYQEGYYSRQKSRRFAAVLEWGIRWFRWERAWSLNRRYRKGRILDVGCGRGLMLHYLSDRFGWEVQGTQISETAHAYATGVLGVPVFLGDLLSLPPSRPFDVVSLYHVLEHLTNPSAYLAEINRRLTPNGACLIEVPNTHSLMARLTKQHWFGWDLPYHTYHFNPNSLKALLEKNGFQVEQVNHWSGEFNTFGVLQSFLNTLFSEDSYLFHLLQRKARVREKPGPALACLFLATVLAPVALVVAAVGAAAGMGEVVRVFARKKSG